MKSLILITAQLSFIVLTIMLASVATVKAQNTMLGKQHLPRIKQVLQTMVLQPEPGYAVHSLYRIAKTYIKNQLPDSIVTDCDVTLAAGRLYLKTSTFEVYQDSSTSIVVYPTEKAVIVGPKGINGKYTQQKLSMMGIAQDSILSHATEIVARDTVNSDGQYFTLLTAFIDEAFQSTLSPSTITFVLNKQEQLKQITLNFIPIAEFTQVNIYYQTTEHIPLQGNIALPVLSMVEGENSRLKKDWTGYRVFRRQY